MPKRTDIESILIIGAGPIVIGQACEFDYSGSQACKVLKEEGYRVILINSNPATIMTDPGLADATYIEPITPTITRQIIEKERPDALLPTMGGQTALNTALALANDGSLDELGVTLIGAKQEAIAKAEDRLKFRSAMNNIGLESPISRLVRSLPEGMAAIDHVGLPAIIRPSFTLGGTGSGIAYNKSQFEELALRGLEASPVTEILVEESVLGWKEYEMEVVRDQNDNAIIVCSIENIDPMGIHTGDSITVAPALTLTDKEYQRMRNASISCLREIGVETGGSNVQFAINPDDGRMVVIEMNPRVSRSSALASKATGFPIAKIAAQLAVGYTLDELQNDITKTTPASFEPTIDYVVTKIPRFTFDKFRTADPILTTSMKSVGEAMALGSNFKESLQKALRSLEIGLSGLDEVTFKNYDGKDKSAIHAALAEPSPERILRIAQAFREGLDVEVVRAQCNYDRWFLDQISELVLEEDRLRSEGLPSNTEDLLSLKRMGFSDLRLAKLVNEDENKVAELRQKLRVLPSFKRVDTCAAEFEARTPYLYSSYAHSNTTGGVAQNCESNPTDKSKIIILGGGPNRIGQGIEFDYCCVHAAYALSDIGYETIMINCNPETVSTDYDTSDRLYFEPLTAEDVMEVVRAESRKGDVKGVVVQLGGQTPLKLAKDLEKSGVKILGTSPHAIDLAEDRERFQQLLVNLDLKQPSNGIAFSPQQATEVAEHIGYPVVIRPSYVLGGQAMRVVYDKPSLQLYIGDAVKLSGKNPVLIDQYLEGAIEVDVDAISDGETVFVAGIMEHIEEAGIHSGDSACSLPPFSLSKETIKALEAQTEVLARALGVIGLMNIQYAIKSGTIYILEVNPRASRTVPFVSKSIGIAVAKIAAQVMAGKPISSFNLARPTATHIAVKEAVFPFARFSGVDTILGPEMKSTGEVMGIDKDFDSAFAKSQLAAGTALPQKGSIFISVKDSDKAKVLVPARELNNLGFQIVATHGTSEYLETHGVVAVRVKKVLEGSPHVVDLMKSGSIQLMFNTTEGEQAIADSFTLRRAALTLGIPYYTTVAGAIAASRAISRLRNGGLEVTPLQSYFKPG